MGAEDPSSRLASLVFGDQPPVEGGPYTHTWRAAEEPGPLQIAVSRPSGRWPGLVPIWNATGGRAIRWAAPFGRWLLYGRRSHVALGAYLPQIEMTFTAGPTDDEGAS